jgi:hypothetical protein
LIPVFSLFTQIKAHGHWKAWIFCLSLLVINSSCHSLRRPIRSEKSKGSGGSSSGDSNKLSAHSNTPDGDTSLAPNPDTGLSVQPSWARAAELEKSWQKILGRKDHRHGDLKLEGTWNIAYNETELSSPVIMLVRPQHFVYISIRPLLGIEMLRIVLRPDSVWMISRLNKNYWCGTWAELEPSLGLPLDYGWFQDALLHGHGSLIDLAVNQKLLPPTSQDQNKRLEASPNKSDATLEAEWGRWPAKIHALRIQSPAGSLNINFSKIFENESSTLPAQMTFALTIPRNNASLEMHWKEPKFQGVEMPSIKIPEDYQKLKLAK